MPRSSDLTGRVSGWLLLLWWGFIAANAAQADTVPAAECTSELSLSAARDGLIDLRVLAPCQPYAEVEIAYGPFVFTEETSLRGRLDLRLPRLQSVPEAAAQIGDTVLFAALPQIQEPPPDYVALLWQGPVGLTMRLPEQTEDPDMPALEIGFPIGTDARRAVIQLVASGAKPPEFVDISVTGQACPGEPIEAALVTSFDAPRLTLSLPAPDCGSPAGFLRLPLGLASQR